jgi:Protein of unknown function (DUF4238)
MAGIRHHILPRFLLKGFASQIKGDKVFTWLYRKGASPLEVSTKDISVEKYFYGKEGEISADDAITQLEEGYGYLVDSLRNGKTDTKISEPLIAEFISHLAIRTKHIRDSFTESTEHLVDRMSEYLSDFNNVKKVFLNHPRMMKEEFFKAAQGRPISQEQMEQLWIIIEPILPAYFDQERGMIEVMRDEFIKQIKGILPYALREGHIKSLARRLVPRIRADDYASLNWSVVESDCSLILGDIGCLFEVAGEVRFKSLDDKGDEIKNIYLPISSNRILIGTSGFISGQINFEEINNAIVHCSRDFFVYSAFSEEKESLISDLGKDSKYLTDAEVEQLINQLIEQINSGALYDDE